MPSKWTVERPRSPSLVTFSTDPEASELLELGEGEEAELVQEGAAGDDMLDADEV